MLVPSDQFHLAQHLKQISPELAGEFSRALQSVDWHRVTQAHLSAGPQVPLPSKISLEAVRATEPSAQDAHQWKTVGLDLLAKGKAAFVLMAGGQGSRLGFEGPKGACPLGLPDNMVLFELVIRRLLRLQALSGRLPAFAVMTSPENHEDTLSWFAQRSGPQLPDSWPCFFQQSLMPALNESGQALLSSPGKLAMVPDGNGGVFESLRLSGILQTWRESGVEWVHIAGVDNVLSLPCDPVFLGFAQEMNLPVSCKTVVRLGASEKVGVFAKDTSGASRVAEYTELPLEQASALDTDQLPVFREANIASHLVRISTVERFSNLSMPWHLARKKVPHIDPLDFSDRSAEPACKYERFLFDAFPSCDGVSLLRVLREDEFAPVKNAEGVDSPESARAALAGLHQKWRSQWNEGYQGPIWIDPLVSYAGELPG